jgi:hypothetical protein
MSLRSAAECLLLTTMLYASALAAFANESDVLRFWVGTTQAVVDTALLFVDPAARSPDPELAIYRHVLFVNLLITATWVCVGRRWLANWAEEVVATYRRTNCGAYPSRAWLDEAHGVSTLGAFCAVYLLLFDTTLNTSWAPFYRAVVFLVPLLCVVAFILVCRAMVFHRLGARLRE